MRVAAGLTTPVRDHSPQILIIEDDDPLRSSFKTYLEDSGYRTLSAANGQQGLEVIQQEQVDLVFTDLLMPVMGGLPFLEAMAQCAPDIPVIVISGAGSVQDAVKALRLGAWDYLVKPIHNLETLEHQIRRALENRELRQAVQGLSSKLLAAPSQQVPDAFAAIATRSPALLAIFRYLEVVAPTTQPILIQGATGTGKELLARGIHTLSRCKGRFVAVNLAGLDDQMFSDTLFGHLRGAFTGADRLRDGLITQAAGGTLLLDEVGDLSESSQIKLLRLLQEGEYYPLGADHPRISKTRFLLATHKNLTQLIAEGRFRQDLYYRLCSHTVQMPSLQERREDLPLLLDLFIAEAEQALGKPVPGLITELLASLQSHPFPGNIRELKALVMNAVARHETDGSPALPQRLPHAGSPENPGSHSPIGSTALLAAGPASLPTLREAEKQLIQAALQRSDGNQGKAAALLGISRTALNKKLAKQHKTSSAIR